MFGKVADIAINLRSLLPPVSPATEERTVFILLTMASTVGPLDSSFS